MQIIASQGPGDTICVILIPAQYMYKYIVHVYVRYTFLFYVLYLYIYYYHGSGVLYTILYHIPLKYTCVQIYVEINYMCFTS